MQERDRRLPVGGLRGCVVLGLDVALRQRRDVPRDREPEDDQRRDARAPVAHRQDEHAQRDRHVPESGDVLADRRRPEEEGEAGDAVDGKDPAEAAQLGDPPRECGRERAVRAGGRQLGGRERIAAAAREGTPEQALQHHHDEQSRPCDDPEPAVGALPDPQPDDDQREEQERDRARRGGQRREPGEEPRPPSLERPEREQREGRTEREREGRGEDDARPRRPRTSGSTSAPAVPTAARRARRTPASQSRSSRPPAAGSRRRPPGGSRAASR